MRRATAIVLLLLASLVALASPLRAADTLTGLLFYATDTDASELTEKAEDKAGDTDRHAAELKKAFKAKKFVLLGRHTAPVSSKYSIWLKPSPQFPLQIENTGTTADGGLSLYWILWQKEKLPTKDRELVKSNTVLTQAAPLLIGGPKWRKGRLVFVVRRD